MKLCKTNDKLLEDFMNDFKSSNVKILHEYRDGSSHTIFGAFLDPFMDVVKSAGLVGQQLLATSKLTFDLAFAFTPVAINRVYDEYKKSEDVINAKWKPLMDKADAALGIGDVAIIAFVLSPAAFLTTATVSRALKTGMNTASYFSEAGIGKKFFASIIPSISDASSGGNTEPSTPKDSPSNVKPSILTRMMNLFMLESASVKSTNLFESTNQSQNDVKKYLSDIGALAEIDKEATKQLDLIEGFYKKIIVEVVPKLHAIKQLMLVKNVDDFTRMIAKLEQSGLNMNSSGLSKMKKTLADDTKKLAKTPEFLKQLQEEAGKDVKIDQKKIELAASKIAFANSIVPILDKLSQSEKLLTDSAMQALDRIEISKSDYSKLQESKNGRRFLEMRKLSEESIKTGIDKLS